MKKLLFVPVLLCSMYITTMYASVQSRPNASPKESPEPVHGKTYDNNSKNNKKDIKKVSCYSDCAMCITAACCLPFSCFEDDQKIKTRCAAVCCMSMEDINT